jgi:4'-phosphopantetheinyl transferase EntD
MKTLLPEGVAFAAAHGDAAAELLPDEDLALGSVAEKRRRDVALGRDCARRALHALGVGPAPIGRGARGEPLWPRGIVGSITHCAGYAAAAVTFERTLRGIGIDAEHIQALSPGLLRHIATESEQAWMAARPPAFWDLLLFSAKESVFKAWYPIARTWLNFTDVELSIEPDDGRFRARVARRRVQEAPDAAPAAINGRYELDTVRVYTVAVIPATPPPRRPAVSE